MSKKILIVEDDHDVAFALKLHLEESGYVTDWASNGVEGLEAMQTEDYAVILLDIKLPHIDGMKILSTIQGKGKAVIVITGHGSEELAVEAMKAGAFDYLPKPFSFEGMLQKVEHVISANESRKQNVRLLRQIEEDRRKMEAILLGMAEVLIAIDLEGTVIMANRRAEVLSLGRDLTGMSLNDILGPSIVSGELPCDDVLRTGEASLNAEVTFEVDGHKIPFLASVTPYLGSEGALTGCILTMTDMTKIKEMEQERDDFVSMLSHDLKSPITSVVGSVDLMREGRLGPVTNDQKEFLGQALQSCDEIVDMIDTLLGVHKFEAGKMNLDFVEEDPTFLVAETLFKFQPVAKSGNIRLMANLPEDEIPPVSADRDSFHRVLSNLLSNSMKFTPEGGEIEVSVDVVEDAMKLAGLLPDQVWQLNELPGKPFVRIQVRDTGAGIPKDALGSIFDRFEQAKNRKMGKTRGTGLGLAFCKKTIDAHNGHIWAQSEEGNGSTFTVLLPAA